MIQVFSTGGGTQSTAISALIIQGKLPKPDYVVIADTGKEMLTTWEYMDQITGPALKKIGIEIVKIKANEWSREKAKGIFTSGALQIPAFSNMNGQTSKLSAFCSKHWKGEPIDRWLSQTQGITRSKYCKWIGFSFDETERILRMQNGDQYKKGLIRFPLVDIPTKRQEAIRIVEKMGWPTPPRSRCWMCPNQSDYEWAEVKDNHPELFKAAINLDNSIRETDPYAFIHSSIKPLQDADLSKPDDLFSASCPSGECFI